jgi:hypothetical protein
MYSLPTFAASHGTQIGYAGGVIVWSGGQVGVEAWQELSVEAGRLGLKVAGDVNENLPLHEDRLWQGLLHEIRHPLQQV